MFSTTISKQFLDGIFIYCPLTSEHSTTGFVRRARIGTATGFEQRWSAVPLKPVAPTPKGALCSLKRGRGSTAGLVKKRLKMMGATGATLQRTLTVPVAHCCVFDMS